ncbi:hypothetical protein EC912_10250 [Luteibacter rhizovicinus]|uniref:CAAX prenyl protease 2/Lysostaphin resistance protein A-like domain-containing protein n=1 Tax=Luteibacter rhizovicinus TaxID=242606 RepID=A0A4R3YTE4_9GAMM|nr:type II CAAX endopeptidase family protein [Luteibacter rhizovicinus]TCV95706.1 hypothetical protein EC912_10250 [Luteibacter rhizovicinus]
MSEAEVLPPPVPPTVEPRWMRWMRSPAARIAIFVVLLIVLGSVARAISHAIYGDSLKHLAFMDVTPLIEALRLLPIVLAYWILVRFVERRRIAELAPRKLVPHVLLGLAAGFALFSAVVGVLWSFGAFTVSGINHDVVWLGPILVLGVGAGVGEEIISRGVLFRIVEEGLGTWAALLISAAFFGGMHLGNPNATTWSALAIALEAGLLFGLVYHVTRSLWVCMGMHAAWNVAQGPFYGIPVSGFDQHGLLASHMQGPDWLTGGAFGAEASVVALALCSILTAVCLAVAIDRGSMVPPFWRRPNRHLPVTI